MNDDHAEPRWFPADRHTISAMRDADTVYAVLGPVTSLRLVALHNAAKESGIAVDDDVSRLMEDLESRVGTLPSMLSLLALSAALSHNMMSSGELRTMEQRHPTVPYPWGLLDRHSGDVVKLFGWQVVEMLQKFGFTPDTFTEYLEREWRHYGEGEWPPATAAYTVRAPESVSRPVAAPPSTDPLYWWRDLWEYFGHPTMIGAHLADMRILDEYVDALRLALGNAGIDAHNPGTGCGPEDAEERLRAAVDQIARARDDIREAQDLIVTVFPT